MAPELLPCGVDRALVAGAALAEPPEQAGHDAGCPHCTGARDHAAARWAHLRDELAVSEPPPASVARAVFASVRSVRRGDWLALPSHGPGRTVVAGSALADLVRRVARPVTGVGSVGDVSVGIDPEAGLAVQVEIDADLEVGLPLPGVAGSVRHAVTSALGASSGVPVHTVDITIR